MYILKENKMANLTLRQIRDIINQLPEHKLDLTATIYDEEEDEFFPVVGNDITGDSHSENSDVIGEYHPFFIIKEN